jgi:hypothetical protein
MVRDLNPPLAPGIPPDAPARRRVDHIHCARPQPGTKAPVGSVPPDGVAVASSAGPCAWVARPPAGAHSLRIAARQLCGHQLGSEVAPPVLPLLSYCTSRTEHALQRAGSRRERGHSFVPRNKSGLRMARTARNPRTAITPCCPHRRRPRPPFGHRVAFGARLSESCGRPLRTRGAT